MSLLHPLAKPLTHLINCRDQAFIDFDDPQPVLLDGNIYMKGRSTPDGHNLCLWKYSIRSNMFSELMFPKICWKVTERDRYILTSVESHLELIYAEFARPDSQSDEYYDNEPPADEQWTDVHFLKLYTYKLLCDNKWEKIFLYSYRSPDPLPVRTDLPTSSFDEEFDDSRPRDPISWDVSAASNYNHLVVTFFRRDKYSDDEYESKKAYGDRPFINVKTMIFNLPDSYMTRKCHCVQVQEFFYDSDDCKITKPFIFVHNDDIFMKVWSGENLKKFSIKSLVNDKHITSYKSFIIPASTYSNLTMLGNQPVIAVSSNTKVNDPSVTYLCAFTSCTEWSNNCVELATFDYCFDPAPIIMGSSDGSKFIAVGMLKVDSQSGSSQELYVLQVVPQGIQTCI